MPILNGNITETVEIDSNGIHNVARYTSANVNIEPIPPIIEELSITPTTSEQSITASSGTDGYSPIIVSAVDNTIDSNIQASNIKSGVSILGVNGSVVESNETTLNVTPTTSAQSLTPSSPYTGYNEVNVSAVTSSIDANIIPGNIKKDVTILGVTGTHEGGGGSSSHCIEKDVNVNNKLINKTTVIDLTGVIDIDSYVLYYEYYNNTTATGAVNFDSLTTVSGDYACNFMFSNCTGITSVDLSALSTISGQFACSDMFSNCTNLVNIDLSSLTSITGNNACLNMFNGCTGLNVALDLSSLTSLTGHNCGASMFKGCTGITSVDLSNLTSLTNNLACSGMFSGCTNLTNVDLSSLTRITASQACLSMFSNCTNLTSINFSALTTISGNGACQSMFINCTNLTSVSFPALKSTSFGSFTDQFKTMLKKVTGCIVHFPSNLEAVIGSWSDVTGGFGGTNCTALFDLPATE